MEKIPLKIEQRDIVLIPFPFSDQTSKKVRPALVISNNLFNRSQDLIVLGITTNITKDYYTESIEKEDLEIKSIEERCCVKIENILKIDKRLVIKKIDSIHEAKFQKILKILFSLFV